jgi:hypothetical protein
LHQENEKADEKRANEEQRIGFEYEYVYFLNELHPIVVRTN